MAKITPIPKAPGNAGNIRTMPVASPSQKVADYATGKRHYGTGRSMPNVGKTPNKIGYAQRDVLAAARKQALLRRAGGK